MAAPWSRIVNTTIKNYIREVEVNILRNRKVTALLKKRGRITFNWSGISMDWKVRYRRVPLSGFADGDTQTFTRQDTYKTAALDWRGYAAQDAMTKGEFLQNRSKEAIIKVFSERATNLMDDVEDNFAEELYIDGTSAANSKRIHGIESCMAGSTAASGNGVVTPTGTYAGLSSVPGFYGGTWTSPSGLSWPNGRGNAEYDFWSPIMVDVGDTKFSATSTWAANCVEAIAYAIIKAKQSPSKTGQLDVFMLNSAAYQQWLAQARTKERIIAQNAKSELVELGFTDTVQQDGFDITWEYGIPSGIIGYGWNLDKVELRSQQAQVWVPDGPTYDDASKSWRWSIDFFGNMVVNPKYQVKLANYTTTSDSAGG